MSALGSLYINLGEPDGELYGCTCDVGDWAADYIVDLTKQRAKLLAVCEELAECARYWSEYDVPIGIVDRLNAAIDEAKGSAA